MKLKDKLIKTSLLFIIVFFFISGLALFGITSLPYESVKAKIDSFASDGKATSFTVERFKQIRFIGLMIFSAGGLFYLGRRQALGYFSNVLTSLFPFSREITQYFKEAIRKEDKIHLYALFLIILIAIAVRLFFISQPMRFDESMTFMTFAKKPLYIGLTLYSAPNNHLFHTFLVHISYLLFGNQPWVIRLPALISGILMVPASYLTIRIFYNKHAALLTAGIAASSSVLIDFSTNARGYTLIGLIFLLILALGAYLKDNRNSGAWFLFAILSAVGFYTIPIMLFPFGIVIMWLFLSIIFQDTNLNRRLLLKDLVVSLIITALLTLALYTPVFLVSGLEAVISNKYVSPNPSVFFSFMFLHPIYSALNDWHRGMPFVMNFILVIGFLASLVFHERMSVHRVPIVMAVILWCIPLLIVTLTVPFRRVWLFLLPLYIGLAFSGVIYLLEPIVSKISNHKSVIFAILAVILSFWLGFNKVQTPIHYAKVGFKDVENVTILLKNYLRPGDRVLPLAKRSRHEPQFEYYFELYGISSEYLISDLDSQLDLDSIKRILIIVKNGSTKEIDKQIDERGLSINNFGITREINRFKVLSLYEMKRLKESYER